MWTLLILIGLGLPGAWDELGLENPGFEAAEVLAGWRAWIYKDGRDPVLRGDATVFHEGGRSLLVEAEDPADVAVGQAVTLPAGSVWRARCWIRTEDLAARDRTRVGAALHIQTVDGATLAQGDSRFGTTDWRKAEAVFRVPPSGEAKIVLFYIGYGKGTGKVWFDDVRLEPIADAGPQTIEIDFSGKGLVPIDVKQGGQFIEPLCNLIPSMTVQQVEGGGFEEDPPWRFAYRRGIDKPHRPWYPDGAVHIARYALDEVNPFNGRRCQRIDIEAPFARAGLSQDGYCTKPDVGYRLSLHLRGTEGVPVFASLHGDGGEIAPPVSLGRAAEEWRKAEATFRAERAEDNATLTIEFEGPGTLWLDRIYLIGKDAVLGIWRPDVVEALAALNPGVIRFGGSALEYLEWENTVGPWDGRAPFQNTYWGGLDANFAGVEEIVQLCRHIRAEPLICVRWTGKTPSDAAAQVQYFNGGIDTPMGARRAQNGHPEPYGILYWQIGNEIAGAAYNASLKAFAEAMKTEDPGIKLISSSASSDTLTAGGGYLDYLCDHHYGCNDLYRMDESFRFLRDQVMGYPGGGIRIAITEWNTSAADWGLRRGTFLTLHNALCCARYHHLMHRYAEWVEIAVRSNLSDSFCSGIIQPGPGWLYLTPTYYIQHLYARAAGSYPLEVRNKAGIPWPLQEPDVSAASSADGRTLRVYLVNTTAKPIDLNFRLLDAPAGVTGGLVHTIADRYGTRTAEVMNSRDDPRRIATTVATAQIRGKAFAFTSTPLSITLLELDLGG